MPVIAPSVVDQISASMSARSLEQQVIASNIANRDTQGYQRLKLSFERALDRASPPTVAADTSAAPVSMEEDLLALSTNVGRYEAMARALGRYFSIVNIITSPTRG